MRVRTLNCATFCPFGRRLINGDGGLLEPGRLVCNCLLIEAADGLVLVDTGFGFADLGKPKHNVGSVWMSIMRPRLDPEETAVRQIEEMGHSARDVRDIVLTHLDFDHAGGLPDFPDARVHVWRTEYHAANEKPSGVKLRRYTPAQWAHGPLWALHQALGEPWFGFHAVRALGEGQTEILLVPLHGHSRGHCGVAVRTERGWILHAGDAYFHHAEVDPARPAVPPGIVAYQQIYQSDREERLHNQRRLRELIASHGGEVEVLCSHDPVYLERVRGREAAWTAQERASGARPAFGG